MLVDNQMQSTFISQEQEKLRRGNPAAQEKHVNERASMAFISRNN
jgi:hypothetical protein